MLEAVRIQESCTPSSFFRWWNSTTITAYTFDNIMCYVCCKAHNNIVRMLHLNPTTREWSTAVTGTIFGGILLSLRLSSWAWANHFVYMNLGFLWYKCRFKNNTYILGLTYMSDELMHTKYQGRSLAHNQHAMNVTHYATLFQLADEEPEVSIG